MDVEVVEDASSVHTDEYAVEEIHSDIHVETEIDENVQNHSDVTEQPVTDVPERGVNTSEDVAEEKEANDTPELSGDPSAKSDQCEVHNDNVDTEVQPEAGNNVHEDSHGDAYDERNVESISEVQLIAEVQYRVGEEGVMVEGEPIGIKSDKSVSIENSEVSKDDSLQNDSTQGDMVGEYKLVDPGYGEEIEVENEHNEEKSGLEQLIAGENAEYEVVMVVPPQIPPPNNDVEADCEGINMASAVKEGNVDEEDNESGDDQEEKVKNENGVEDIETATPVLVRRNAYDIDDGKNYQNDILADWNDGGQTPAVNGYDDANIEVQHENEINTTEVIVESGENINAPSSETTETIEQAETYPDPISKETTVLENNPAEAQQSTDDTAEPTLNVKIRKRRGYRRKYNVSSEEALEEMKSGCTPVKPLFAANNDLILSLELAKDAKQRRLEPEQKKMMDKKREEILEILEAEDVDGWRQAVPPAEIGKVVTDDLLINKEINEPQTPNVLPDATDTPETPIILPEASTNVAETPSELAEASTNVAETPSELANATPKEKPKPKPRGAFKRKTILTPNGERDREAERLLALHQLQTQFPERQRKPKGKLAVAAFDLERALSSTPLMVGQKRRPCYLPPEQELATNPHAIIKTYTPKRRSIDSNCEIQTGLETIASINKHLNASKENNNVVKEGGEVPKLKEPVRKKVKVLKKRLTDNQGKKSRELRKLLADEGAVRMLYDAANRDSSTEGRTTKKTMKELQRKTKFVQKAMQSSASEKTLRGKRVTTSTPTVEKLSPPVEEPLFAAGASSSGTTKPRKKQRAAEASKILYRHSSSESFDGSEGPRRTAAEIAELDEIPSEEPTERRPSVSVDATPVRKSSRPRKVNSKFSEWITDGLSIGKAKKPESRKSDIRPVPDLQEITDRTPLSGKRKGKKEEPVEEEQKVAAANDADAVKDDVIPSVAEEVQVDPAPVEQIEPEVKEEESVPKASPSTSPSKSKKRRTEKKRTSEVQMTESGSLLEITLTSVGPSIQNSVTPEVLVDLRKALEEAKANLKCKAVLFTSTGETFCQGIDLSLLGPNYDVARLVDEIKAFVTELANFSKPIIAGVHGPCVGFGAALLPLCDVVIASDKATFYTPYTRLCQSPEGAASVTFPRIGTGLVSELVYKCSKLRAADAARLGLVSQCVSSRTFEAELKRAAETVCEQPLQALQSVKELMTEPGRAAVLAGLARECDALLHSWAAPDCLQAIAAFLASGELLPNS